MTRGSFQEVAGLFREDPGRRAFPRCGLGACIVLLILGCASPLSPTYIQVPLQELHVDEFYSVLRDTGLIALAALPADTSYRVGTTERIRIQVTTSSGDSETVELEKEVCIPGPYLCTSLFVTMRDGHGANELYTLLESVPARLWGMSVSTRYAGVRVFDSRDVPRAERALRAHPGVQFVGRDLLGSAGDPTTSAYSRLFAAAPIDFSPVVRGDHRIQVAHGDSVWLSYGQPRGGRLENAVQVP